MILFDRHFQDLKIRLNLIIKSVDLLFMGEAVFSFRWVHLSVHLFKIFSLSVFLFFDFSTYSSTVELFGAFCLVVNSFLSLIME